MNQNYSSLTEYYKGKRRGIYSQWRNNFITCAKDQKFGKQKKDDSGEDCTLIHATSGLGSGVGTEKGCAGEILCMGTG